MNLNKFNESLRDCRLGNVKLDSIQKIDWAVNKITKDITAAIKNSNPKNTNKTRVDPLSKEIIDLMKHRHQKINQSRRRPQL